MKKNKVTKKATAETPSCMKACGGKFFFCALLVFLWFMLVGYVAHHHCLAALYAQTQNLWRAPADMRHTFKFAVLHEAIIALAVTALYAKLKKAKLEACAANPPADGKKECPIQRGLCFGVLIGLIAGPVAANGYVALPIPLMLAIGWLVMWLIKGIGAGLILSFTFCPKKAA